MPPVVDFFFFFNDTATTEIYTLSLHDALPIYGPPGDDCARRHLWHRGDGPDLPLAASALRTGDDRTSRASATPDHPADSRSEEHTSELQSRQYLVCRLLLEKKKK